MSTIGGNVSTNAGGPHCLKYGVTLNHILGVTVVLEDGASVTLRRGERTVTLPATCSEELRFATPRDYLLELAAAAGR